MENIQKKALGSLLGAIATALLLLPASASAATLFLSPSKATVTVGQTFTVYAVVGSPDQAMNAASGTITYPTDLMEMTSADSSGSIINFWTSQPSFSGAAGQAKFEGVVINPGYTGTSGRLMTMRFKAKAVGTAKLSFTSATVLANDGLGTNILQGTGGATFSVVAAGQQPPPTPEALPTPKAPALTSPTHSDPERWYNATTVQFAWLLTRQISEVSYLFDQKEDTVPGTVGIAPISAASYKNVTDGVWYFHVRLKNVSGWGQTAHIAVHVDSTPPEKVAIYLPEGGSTTESQPTISFQATDSTSGIEHYAVSVDGGEPIVVIPTDQVSNVQYQLPRLELGKHDIGVEAYDRADNRRTATAVLDYEILPVPYIDDFPGSLMAGTRLTITGRATANADVTIWLQRGVEAPEIMVEHSDAQGFFTHVTTGQLEEGAYAVWAQVKDNFGSQSGLSGRKTVQIQPLLIVGVDLRAFAWYAVFMAVSFLLLFLILFLLIGWHRRRDRVLANDLKKDIQHIMTDVKHGYGALDGLVHEELEKLERHLMGSKISKDTEEACRRLRQQLKRIEKAIVDALKELRDKADKK